MSWNFSTTEELEAAGYRFLNESRCSGPTCGATISWWETPNGKRMPLDPDTLGPHWGSCPDRDQFKKGRS